MILSGGISAGIKSSGELDLAIIDAGSNVTCAAVFTDSQAAAAPVRVSRSAVADGRARAVVINSGCANAGTGVIGTDNAQTMQRVTARALGCDPDQVLVCSTGPIGPQLPMERITSAIGVLADQLTTDGWDSAAEAILTTDTYTKVVTASRDGVRVWGMAKGAAMVRPNMATMLAVLVTNANLSSNDLDQTLRVAVAGSFNSLNIDGCQSTNDTVIALATGGATAEASLVESLMGEVSEALAFMIARDAEETSRVVTVHVTGAATDAEARTVGLVMTDSDLVRSSFYGGDPNWGRLLQAAGVSGVPIDVDRFAVSYQGVDIAADGVAVDYDVQAIRAALTGDFSVTVRIGKGPGRARIITTDLTPGYVAFNAEPS